MNPGTVFWFLAVLCTAVADSSEEARCSPGEKIDKGSCWDCKCVDGLPKCVPLCTGDDYQDLECTPGDEFFIECNRCTCGTDRVPDCTRKGCVNDPNRNKGILGLVAKTLQQPREKRSSDCKPGTHWQEDCNSCVCGENGVKACTLKLCSGPTVNVPHVVDP